MTDEARTVLAGFLDGQLDTRIGALVAIVEHGDDPRELRALGIVRWVIVGPVLDQLLHAQSQP